MRYDPDDPRALAVTVHPTQQQVRADLAATARGWDELNDDVEPDDPDRYDARVDGTWIAVVPVSS